MMSSSSTESQAPSRKTGPLRRVSGFFYAKSTLVTALLATAVFAGYTVLILSGQGKAFEVANSSVKSLGTSLGFGQTEVLTFLAERSVEQITAYIAFNQVWDSLFGVIYGVMYVVWVSLLFKPYSLKVGLLNLLPFGQVLFDWLEKLEDFCYIQQRKTLLYVESQKIHAHQL